MIGHQMLQDQRSWTLANLKQQHGRDVMKPLIIKSMAIMIADSSIQQPLELGT